MEIKEQILSKGPLVPRVGVALVLVPGAQKFISYTSQVEFFESLGIPFAAAMVLVVGSVEVVCGLAVVVGFAGRVAGIALAVVMVGVFVTAEPNPQAAMVFVSSLLVAAGGTGEYSVADEGEVYERLRGLT